MKIDLNKDAFGTKPDPNGPPNKSTRNLATNVLVDNGSTIVIGGLYETSSLDSVAGIPFLKDLPLLGWLFRQPKFNSTKKTELIIFMTPRIINQEEAGLSEKQTAGTSVDSTPL
jgi:type IV pilus assembly protein PilQ